MMRSLILIALIAPVFAFVSVRAADPQKGKQKRPVAKKTTRYLINATLIQAGKDGNKVIAEPSLAAMQGNTAELVIGGEMAMPVRGLGEQVEITYESFGHIVRITPVGIKDGKILVNTVFEKKEILSSDDQGGQMELSIKRVQSSKYVSPKEVVKLEIKQDNTKKPHCWLEFSVVEEAN